MSNDKAKVPEAVMDALAASISSVLDIPNINSRFVLVVMTDSDTVQVVSDLGLVDVKSLLTLDVIENERVISSTKVSDPTVN